MVIYTCSRIQNVCGVMDDALLRALFHVVLGTYLVSRLPLYLLLLLPSTNYAGRWGREGDNLGHIIYGPFVGVC